MTKTIDNILGKTFDSREVIDRIAELENDNTNDDGEIVFEDEDEKEEYGTLKAFEEDVEGYASDYKYGTTFIRDDYFQDYAEELAEDIGAFEGSNAEWPIRHIDWEAAAEELQTDYTSVEIDGTTYWYL